MISYDYYSINVQVTCEKSSKEIVTGESERGVVSWQRDCLPASLLELLETSERSCYRWSYVTAVALRLTRVVQFLSCSVPGFKGGGTPRES